MSNWRKEYSDDFYMDLVELLMPVPEGGITVVRGQYHRIGYVFDSEKWKLKLSTEDSFWDPEKLVMLAGDVLSSVFSECTNSDVCEFIAVFGVPRRDNFNPDQAWKATVTIRIRDYLS